MSLDIKAAFPSLKHQAILDGLRRMGVLEAMISLFTEYLRGRRMIIRDDGRNSRPRSLSNGTPMGSSIGPVLFLVAFNGIRTQTPGARCFSFADDSSLVFNLQRSEGTPQDYGIEAALEDFADQAVAAGLQVHPEKMNLDIVGNRRGVGPQLDLSGRGGRQVRPGGSLTLIRVGGVSGEQDFVLSKYKSIVGKLPLSLLSLTHLGYWNAVFCV